MRTYETIFIIHPDAVGEAYSAIVDKFKGVLNDQGCNVLKVEEWGTRKLSYTVKKQGRGSYVLVAYEAGPKVIAEFERRLRIDENIIKFQTVLLENGLEETVAPKEGAAEAFADAAEAEEETEENA
jgi:small subunit ribosomal protein S6